MTLPLIVADKWRLDQIIQVARRIADPLVHTCHKKQQV